MEGIKDGTLMKQLTLGALAIPLAGIVRKKCPRIDLLVCVAQANEAHKSLEITATLAAQLGQDLKDVCCSFVHQIGSDKWRVLTTHGNVQILSVGQDFEVRLCCNHQTPRETKNLRQLTNLRGGLMSESLGLPKQVDVPYPKIEGHVLLCGDFSLWDSIGLLALRHIFTANGAVGTTFATPVIRSSRCHALMQQGLDVARLHPPERVTGMYKPKEGTVSSV